MRCFCPDLTKLLARAALAAWVAASVSGCSSNLSRFDVINSQTQTTTQITRSEIADQGSGSVASVVGPGGHTLSRATVGGYYLRRTDVAAAATGALPPGSRMSAGLFGNPRASK